MIKNIIYLIASCAFLCACADDEIYSSTNVKEGIPVTMHFDLSVAGMDVLTRALPDAEESRINDLYVFVFNKSGSLKSRKFFTTDEVVSAIDNKKKGKFSIETTSGECYIYAVANVETNELEPLVNKLNAVTNIGELTKVFAKLDEPNVQRIQGSLVMSGAFEPISSAKGKKTGYCVIDENGNPSIGKIKLSRLDSHITFKIKVGSDVTSFTPSSWQVINVPLKSNVIEQPGVNSFSEEKDFGNSKVNTAFGTTDNARVFDFYMLENIKNAKTYTDKDGTVNSIDPKGGRAEYAKREAEVKENGKNTGVYKYSEEYATYVEIKAALEIKLADNTKRVANVQYRIHLGGGTDNPDIFTSERNAKYTYNITINNVNDIIVEVTKKEENRPGAEGDVIDSKAEVRTLDAHYNSFIMGFSYNHVADQGGNPNLKFLVKTPFGEVTDESNADDPSSSAAKQDYHWIQFRSHENANSENTLQRYDEKELVDLFGLAEDVIRRYNQEGGSDPDKLYYYTVFIDEYYYTEAPSGQSWGNDPTTYWHHFANADNRYVMLVYAPKYSPDGNSSYAQARYMITQRSIQTYYSNNSELALGMEHVNETGIAEWGTPNIADYISTANGLWNTWKYLERENSWATHVNLDTPDTKMNTFTTKGNTLALARCLSRNRDENGDGEISLDEVKWYVPTSEQLMGMYLGAKSLPTPLYDANNINFVYADITNYHYTTSDKKRIWSEEGASVGKYPDSNKEELPKNFRCVRNLGMDKKSGESITQEEYPKQAFEYIPEGTRVKVYNQQSQQDEIITADRVFKMSRLTELNIRGSRLNRGEIGLHDNFEEGNKPYKAFQMAKNKQTYKGGEPIYAGTPVYEGNSFFRFTNWHAVIRSSSFSKDPSEAKPHPTDHTMPQCFRIITNNDVSICKNYFENDDQSDKGLWRAPNQREMMLMYIQDKNFTKGTMSRTTWRYVIPSGNNAGNVRFFCGGDALYLSNHAETFNEAPGVRCVRDVEIVNN